MANFIQEFDAGNLGVRPTETGIDARVSAGRTIRAKASEQASALDTLARENDRLAGATKALGRDTEQLGGETVALGARTGQAYAQVGQSVGSGIATAGVAVERYLDHKQISKGSADYAKLMAEKTAQWNEVVKNADPNDPTVAKQFLEKTEEELEKFRDGFYTENGQKWAEAHVAAFRQHFTEKTAGDMATLAGHAAIVNQQQTINSLSATVHSDPSSIDIALASLKTSTEGMISTSPNLSGTQAARARSEILQKGAEAIVKSAAVGYIEKTAQMPPWISDPKYAPYVNGAELKTFEQAAKSYQRLNASEARSARSERDYNNRNDFNKQVNDLEVRTLPQTAGDKPVLPPDYWTKLRDLAQHPGAQLDPGRLKTMVDNGERLTERLNKPEPLGPVSHAKTMDLLARIQSSDPATRLNDNKEIYKAYGDGELNNADYNFLQKEFAMARTPEGEQLNARTDDLIKAIAPQIDKSNPMMGTFDLSGKESLYRFTFALKAKINEYRKAGKNPYDLLDPTKPDYMGSTAAVEQYQKSLQQSQVDAAARRARAAQPAPADPSIPPPVITRPQRKPGESAADYIKRVGGN